LDRDNEVERADRASAEEMAGRAEQVLAELLTATGADRCTLRYDDPDRGWTVQLPCAEVLIGEAKSLRAENSVDQRAAATVKWLEANRRILVQPDLADTDAPAPAALIKAYGVRAQMLGPLFRDDGHLQGWISVHYLKLPGGLGRAKVAAMQEAILAIRRLFGLFGGEVHDRR
jgi:GAF domain-containing protein